ncbi:MAG TPA: glycosyltransferase family 4 protein [Gemmatimonadaceae bacterium]|nr:glycosyltransferase family 4 protein [Gemmatimonadaceae bacterium]
MRRCRLGVLASHPIQYFTPLYQRLAATPAVDLEVLYYSDYGVVPRHDREFGQAIQWDVDQLSDYRHRFLRNLSPVRDTFNPLHAFNPGVFAEVLRSFDAIWLNGYTYPSNWLALAAARLGRTPILFRSELRLARSRLTGLAAALRERVIREWVRRSDALLYIGEENRRAYLAYGASEEKLFFTPYSVDVERIEQAASAGKEALRQAWEVPLDARVLLYAGKLTPRKHPEMLLEVVARLREISSVCALVVGSGPLEQELRRIASEQQLSNVRFTGFVNQRRLPELYALSDVFVMPSEDEPWGLVLNEAMAAGAVPVVSSHVGAAADLIIDGETGFVLPPGEGERFTERVRELVTDDARRAAMSAAARRRAGAYSYDATVGGILRALESLGLIHASHPAPAMAAGAHP